MTLLNENFVTAALPVLTPSPTLGHEEAEVHATDNVRVQMPMGAGTVHSTL